MGLSNCGLVKSRGCDLFKSLTFQSGCNHPERSRWTPFIGRKLWQARYRYVWKYYPDEMRLFTAHQPRANGRQSPSCAAVNWIHRQSL